MLGIIVSFLYQAAKLVVNIEGQFQSLAIAESPDTLTFMITCVFISIDLAKLLTIVQPTLLYIISNVIMI
ncbi:MAG: hypothetical protein JWR54_2852 [Mucilaginibacter sp.]|nr:hypothetical protein [Mucilaginibacter sp.]